MAAETVRFIGFLLSAKRFGMGRILPRPWVVGGEVVARQIVQLSLVFDHRVCDGGTAGGFLRFVADCVEAPKSAMADL